MKLKAAILTLTVAALAWGYGSSARASSEPGAATVLASESVMLQESGSVSTSLAIPGPGELFVTLTDLQFPTSFSTLQYSIANANGALVPLTAAGNTVSLNLTAPDTLYANVFASIGQSGAGLFNLTATFLSASAVPLPGSLGLFASAGLLLALLKRGRPRRQYSPG